MDFLSLIREFPPFKLIASESLFKFDSQFTPLSHSTFNKLITPIKQYIRLSETTFDRIEDSFHFYQSRLLSGEKVTLTIIDPIAQQRKKFDLFPFRLLTCSLSLFFGEKTNIFSHFLEQLDFSIPKEIQARIKILQSFGVNFNQPPSRIFRSSRDISFPFYVPAPLKQFSTSNVLVFWFIRITNQFSSTDALSKSLQANFQLFRHISSIIPSLSIASLRKTKLGFSLNQFSRLSLIDRSQFIGCLSDSHFHSLDFSSLYYLNTHYPRSTPQIFHFFGNIPSFVSDSFNQILSNLQNCFSF